MEVSNAIAYWIQALAGVGTCFITWHFYSKLVSNDDRRAKREQDRDDREHRDRVKRIAKKRFEETGTNHHSLRESANALADAYPSELYAIVEAYAELKSEQINAFLPHIDRFLMEVCADGKHDWPSPADWDRRS